MINIALYKREMKGSIKLLIIFGAVITMYVAIIVGLYNPEMMKTLDSFAIMMPDHSTCVQKKKHTTTIVVYVG